MNRDKYKGADKAAEVCQIMPREAVAQMENIVDECLRRNQNLCDPRMTGKANLSSRAGFVFEELQAESANFDSFLKNEKIRFYTDRDAEYPFHGNNETSDVVGIENSKIVYKAQLKNCNSAENTADAFKKIKDGRVKYSGEDQYICPKGQQKEIIASAQRSLKTKGNNPLLDEANRNICKKTTDSLQHGKVKGNAISNQFSKDCTPGQKDAVRNHQKFQNQYKTKSTLQESITAAGTAAVVSSVISGTINTFHYLDLVQKGEMKVDDAVEKILVNTAVAAGDSALKAGGATMTASMTARVFPEFFRGSVLQNSLATGFVAGTAVCAIDLVECLVLFTAGKISKDELETRTGTNFIQTATGSVGASIGAAVGAVAGPVGAMIGGIVGGMVTSVAATMCIENHVERPYAENLANTEAMIQTEKQLLQIINTARLADIYFANFYRDFAIDYEQSQRDFALLHEMRKQIDRDLEESTARLKQKLRDI